MTNPNNNSDEISLMTMLYAGLRKWRQMIIFAVVFAMLLGSFGAYKAIVTARHEYANVEELMQIRDKKKEVNRDVENAELNNEVILKKIANQQEYLDNSIWINLEPYDIHCAEVEYYIDTEYQIMPGMTYQNTDYTDTIAAIYCSQLLNDDRLNYVAEKHNTELRYLKELINITVSNRVLKISVIEKDDESAKSILDDIVVYIPDIGKDITDSIADHSILLINESQYSYVNLELIDRQKEQNELLITLNRTKEDNDTIIKDADYILFGLGNEEQKISQNQNIIRAVLKLGIIGVAIGAILAFIYGCFKYVLGRKIYISNELSTRYGINVIGTIASGKNSGFIDKEISKVEGRAYGVATDKDYEVIAGNISGMKDGVKSIFITGAIDTKKLESITHKIIPMLKDTTIEYGTNIVNNPDAINKLLKCEGIILVEECGKSKYDDIEKELSKAEWFGKKIIGCVVIE